MDPIIFFVKNRKVVWQDMRTQRIILNLKYSYHYVPPVTKRDCQQTAYRKDTSRFKLLNQPKALIEINLASLLSTTLVESRT